MSAELGRRIAFTLCALLVFRLGIHIPIPGIDPAVWQQFFRGPSGEILGMLSATAAHLDYAVSRTTILGAAYLALIALIPELAIAYAKVPFYLGGVSALIVVCVVLDIAAQVRGDGLVNTGG